MSANDPSVTLIRWSIFSGTKFHLTNNRGESSLCGQTHQGRTRVIGEREAFERAGLMDSHVCKRCLTKDAR